MTKVIKKKSSLYQFLQSSGVLENGNDREIVSALRKKYWANYKREHRRNKRKKEKALTLWFDRNEYIKLTKEANTSHMSRPRFAKQSVLAYWSKTYVVPDSVALHAIKELLFLNHTALQQILEERIISLGAEKDLLKSMQHLEDMISSHLYSPRTLEELMKEELFRNPDKLARFQNIINNSNI